MRSITGILALAIVAACSGDKVTLPHTGDPGPNTDVQVAFCNNAPPAWVAFQDGDGAWTQALPNADGAKATYRKVFQQGRGGIATARRLANGLTTLWIYYGAPEELAAVGDFPVNCASESSTTLLGTIAGLDANDVASVSASFSNAFIFHDGTNSFVLSDLVKGPQSILGLKNTRGDDGILRLTRVILRRVPELPDSATIPVLDFNSSEAVAPAVKQATVNGMGSDGVQTFTQLITANSRSVISFATSARSAATRSFDAIPESQLLSGDLQMLTAFTDPTAAGQIRSASVVFHSPADQILTLGPAIVAPIFSVVESAPVLRLRATFPALAAYDRVTTISWQQGQNTIVTLSMTPAYAGVTSTGYEMTIPDLSGVAGFDPLWALAPNGGLFWSATRLGGTYTPSNNAVPVNGSVQRSASLNGTFNP